MSNNLEQLGTVRLYEEMSAGRSVLPLFRALLAEYGTPRIAILTGAVSGGIGLVAALQRRGVKMTVSYPADSRADTAPVMYRGKQKKPWEKAAPQTRALNTAGEIAVQMTRSLQTDLMAFCDELKVLAATLDTTRGMFDWKGRATDPEPKERAPIKVEVVAMPTRQRTTTITRNSVGDIESSSATECDVAAT